MRTAARLLFWLSLLAIGFVTLAPIEFRPITELPPQIERFGAFLAITVPLMIGYPRYRLLGLGALVIAAGMLEVFQNWVPGRHGRLHDFEAKAAGVLAGAVLGLMGEALVRLKPRNRHGASKR